MRAIAGLDMVALQMKGNVSECLGVAVDVEGADGSGGVLAIAFGGLELAEEVLRKVRRSWM